MAVAALITWMITATGGGYLFVTWLIRGGIRQSRAGATSLPTPLIFGHFLLAGSGLVTWIAYLRTEDKALAWAALTGLVLVAVLGFTMFLRWGGEADAVGPAARGTTGQAARPGPARGGPASGAAPATAAAVTAARTPAERPAESHFPILVVAAHGALAVTTFSLVLLAIIGVGN